MAFGKHEAILIPIHPVKQCADHIDARQVATQVAHLGFEVQL
jgi:hypothetical protein